jgi:hypothetical protein
MNKKYFIMIFLMVFIALAFLRYEPALVAVTNNHADVKGLRINGQTINVEIADTLEKQEKGLSGRQSLGENQGMLFVFQTSGYYSFWMKDMNFGLDFVWISGNEIVEIIRNVKPEDFQPPNYLGSKNKIDKVLEINAGVADKLGIKEGDKIEF